MANQEKFIKKQKDKTRLEVLRTFMSSFTLTAVAVVVAALIIPKSPIAQIESIGIFQNEIVYQISVTDEDHALDLSTLKIVLQGQLETYSFPLDLGLNVGIFEDLRSNTSYQMTIYGSKGFGDENLASLSIVTRASSNGAIISYELLEAADYFLNYRVDVLLNDEENLYSEVHLYYAYLFPYQDTPTYERVLITDSRQTIALNEVPNEQTEIHLYLSASLVEGGTLILDELRLHTPIKLETYFDLDQITSKTLKFQFYKDYYFVENVSYIAQLYFGKSKIREVTIEDVEGDFHDYQSYILFSNLKPNTQYKMVISATYINPHTKRSETVILHEAPMTTLDHYQIDYTITRYEDYSEIYMHLIDPNHYFQVPYYYIYEIDTFDLIYYEGNTFEFTPELNAKSVTFTINHPNLSAYQLVVGVRNQNDYSINETIIDQKIGN